MTSSSNAGPAVCRFRPDRTKPFPGPGVLALCLLLASGGVLAGPLSGAGPGHLDHPSAPPPERPDAPEPDSSAKVSKEPANPSLLTLEGAWTTDLFRASGRGDSRGSVLHNLDLSLSLQGNEGFWPGGRAVVYLLGNSGNALSSWVGDLQGINNIEAPAALRLYEAWVEQALLSGRASLLVGLFDLNRDFYATERADVFIHASHGIGAEMAQSGEAGPSIFPLTSLAARLQLNLGSGVTTRVAVLDAVPGDPAEPTATTVRISGDEGALLVGEVEYAGAVRVAGGYWRYSREVRPEWRADQAGPTRSHGAYLLAEGDLARWGAAGVLGAFGRIGVANPGAHEIGLAWGGGLTATGLLDARRDDRVGLAVAVAALGDPFVRNDPGLAGGVAASEAAFEVVYQATFPGGFSASVDLQAIRRPGGHSSSSTVVALGHRISVSF